jgi:peptidoglycan/LPS O-acetylase OafA/YrhL
MTSPVTALATPTAADSTSQPAVAQVPEPRPPRTDHRALNAMRTIAATLVVLTHVRALFFADPQWESAALGDRIVYILTAMGPAAVLVFFVLSGYWVGGSVLSSFRRGSFRWSTYGSARLTRLWIVLIPAIALTALLDNLGLTLFPSSSVYVGDAAYHLTVPAENLDEHLSPIAALGNILFVQTNLVPTYGTNASLWSLAYEATFYLVLPLALFTVFARRTWAKLLSLALLLVVCAIGGLDVLMYLPVWLLGAVVAWNKDRIAGWLMRMKPSTLTVARLVAVAALVTMMCLTALKYSNLNVLLLALATTILVALLVVDVQWTGASGKALGGLSRYADSSYTLYAIHLPIVALVAAIVVPDAAQRWEATPLHWAAGLGLVVVLLVIGWLVALVTELRTDRLRSAIERRLPVGSESGTGFGGRPRIPFVRTRATTSTSA